MLDKYYNNDTKRLLIPHTFNEELINIPKDTNEIYFLSSETEINYGHEDDEYEEDDPTMRSNFNQEILPHTLPNKIKKIKFGFRFNKEIKPYVLPNSLNYLTFGYYYDKEIKPNVLPHNLISLIFGWSFNQNIKCNTLPNSLKFLRFGNNFNQEIRKNTLPNSLELLMFGYEYNRIIKENILPIGSLTLIFDGCEYSKNTVDNLPPGIEKIEFKNLTFKLENLPPSIREIHINDYEDIFDTANIKYRLDA